jgi:hypothetical protein
MGAKSELVSEALKERASQLFGPVEFYVDYGMTEIWPFKGQSCSEGHLHFDLTSGMLEVKPLLRARWANWLVTLLLIGADVWTILFFGAASTTFFLVNNPSRA